MSDDTSRTDTETQDESDKSTPKARRKSSTPRKGQVAKVTGVTNSMYLNAGDVVHVTVTDQIQDLAKRGFVKIEAEEDNG